MLRVVVSQNPGETLNFLRVFRCLQGGSSVVLISRLSVGQLCTYPGGLVASFV